MNSLWLAVIALLIVSFMWPSEGAVNGDGLHWSILWVFTAAAACWRNRSKGAAWETGRSRLDSLGRNSPWIIVAGVWFSTAHVFHLEGDRRAAVNIAFEWTAILAASVLFWQFQAGQFRQRMGAVLIGLGLGIAVMGVLQYHVVWEQRAEWYLERMTAIEAWQQNGTGSVPALEAEAELRASQVPLEGAAKETFRRRLLDSTEPVGPFALANTLGGFLSVVLVILFGAISNSLRKSKSLKPAWMAYVMPFIWVIVIGYALVLTKSRTAWVSVVAGGLWLVATSARAKTPGMVKLRSAAKPLVVVGVLGIALIAAGIAGGAVDREVLLESPRSLRFRLMYWIGTLDLLKERWWFGTGPGNFRNAYLQFKMPEASEQILDPHNLFLDTYSCAGLIGVIGLIILMFAALRSKSIRIHSEAVISDEPLQNDEGRYWIVMTASFLSAVLFLVWHWFTGASLLTELTQLPDGGLLVLAVPLCVLVVAICYFPELSIDRSVYRAAFITLAVHLMGAGAFQITSVGLMLVCLHRGACRSEIDGRELQAKKLALVSSRRQRLAGAAAGLVFASLSVTMVIFGLIPVRRAEQAVAVSHMAEAGGRLEMAVAALDDGIREDKLNVRLRQRKAELMTYSLKASLAEGETSARIPREWKSLLDEAMAACELWRLSDTSGYREFVVRSENLEASWSVTKDTEYLKKAIAAMAAAVSRYPTNVESLSRLAILQDQADLSTAAKLSASSALAQEKVNREWGHAELYLEELTIKRLQEILD